MNDVDFEKVILRLDPYLNTRIKRFKIKGNLVRNFI